MTNPTAPTIPITKDGSFASSPSSNAKASDIQIISPAPVKRKPGRPYAGSFTPEEAFQGQDTSGANDVKERMSDFIEKHAAAKALGEMWVETTPEIIALLQPRGLGGAKFFCYQGVKVCAFGDKEGILADEEKTVHDRLHPYSQVKVISGATG